MSNGGAKRSCGSFYWVDMNPLMITSGFGKLVDPLLIDKDRFSGAQLMADNGKQVAGMLDDKCGHARLLFLQFITAADIAGACLPGFSPFALR